MSLQSIRYAVNRFVLRRELLSAKADFYDLRLTVPARDVVGRHIYKYGAHERATSEFLVRNLEIGNGDIVFDVGANIGWYSLLLDRIAGQSNARIYSFEPDPSNYALLRDNVRRNDCTHVVPLQNAVADRAATMTLHLYGDTNRGRHSMLPLHDGESVEVEAVTLDDFCTTESIDAAPVRFMKIDIEGFELMALRGAENTLARAQLVMLEYSPRYMTEADLDPEEVLALMLEQGFSAYELAGDNLVPVDTELLKGEERHRDLFWRR